MRLVSFGARSGLVYGSFLRRFLFLLVSVTFALLLALPWCLSAVPAFTLSFTLGSKLFCGCHLSPLFNSWFSLPSLAVHLSRRLLCLSLLQGPPSVCGLFRSIVFLGGRVAHWVVSLLFLFAPSCSSPVVRQPLICCFLFFILRSVSGIFSLPSSFCLGLFRPLC